MSEPQFIITGKEVRKLQLKMMRLKAQKHLKLALHWIDRMLALEREA